MCNREDRVSPPCSAAPETWRPDGGTSAIAAVGRNRVPGRGHASAVHRALAWRRVVVLAAALVVLIATPAVAAGPGGYGIAPGRGTFATLTTNQLVPPGGGFDEMYYLSTSGTTGRTRLPFPVKVYNQTYRNLAISSNGNIQLGVVSPGGDPRRWADDNDCIPTVEDFGAAVIFPLWSFGMRYNTAGGEGIYLRTQGTYPHRTFTISWQGQFQVSAVAPANFQVTFREGSQTMTFTYGELIQQHLITIGIQSRTKAAYTQWICHDKGNNPAQGTRLTLGHVNA
jgi:hypothetical protein